MICGVEYLPGYNNKDSRWVRVPLVATAEKKRSWSSR